MGHDITGYRRVKRVVEGTDVWNEGEDRVAYLRRNAFTEYEHKIEIYNALNAEDHYGGVSGDGGGEVYTGEEIENALDYAERNSFASDVIKFLEDCRDSCNDSHNSMVYIEYA